MGQSMIGIGPLCGVADSVALVAEVHPSPFTFAYLAANT